MPPPHDTDQEVTRVKVGGQTTNGQTRRMDMLCSRPPPRCDATFDARAQFAWIMEDSETEGRTDADGRAERRPTDR